MKKILILGTILALLAILAVPMAAFADTTGSTQVNGTVTDTTISVTPPGYFAFEPFHELWNGPPAGGTQGTVTFTQGTAAYNHWQLKVYSKNDGTYNFSTGQMWCSSIPRSLDNYMSISLDNAAYTPVYDPGIIYNGDQSASYNYWIYAMQYITHNDATAGAGTYFIIIYSEVSLVL